LGSIARVAANQFLLHGEKRMMQGATESVTTNDQTTTSPANRSRSDWRLFAAAGAAALAATSAADAAIIYQHTNMPSASLPRSAGGKSRGSVFKNFSVDGVPFELGMIHHQSGNSMYIKANSSNLIGGPVSGALRRFQSGQAVTMPKGSFTTSNGNRYSFKSAAFKGKFTHFSGGHSGFFGFELPGSKGGGYGWMNIDFVLNPANPGFTGELAITDLAYNDGADPANLGISAGDGRSVPEPSALGLLAMGSTGVLAWRRRRNDSFAGT
jgi:hypothetical protein